MKHAYDDLKLPSDLKRLYELMRELCLKLREYRHSRWKRSDPFMEMLFDRSEKGEWHGYEDVVLHDSTTVTGDVAIGRGTFVGPQCNLDGSGGLVIGNHCSIAVGTRIFSHDSVKWAVSGGKHPVERSATVIEDNCFIGANSVVLRGVRIGRCSVVGAGAVVTSDVAPNTIVAGVPAGPIGKVVIQDGHVHLSYSDSEEPIT